MTGSSAQRSYPSAPPPPKKKNVNTQNNHSYKKRRQQWFMLVVVNNSSYVIISVFYQHNDISADCLQRFCSPISQLCVTLFLLRKLWQAVQTVTKAII